MSQRVNYPEAKLHEIPYTSPPPPTNPVVRGLALHYGASLISSLNFLQNFLWSNAGFSRLRGKAELVKIAPRYDPTVILPRSSDGYTDEQLHQQLLDPDYWKKKQLSSRLYPSALDYHAAFNSGLLTPTAVAEALLPLIRRDVASPSKHSTAFLDVRPELVLQAAKESTERYASGKPRGVLDGVPVAVKDEVDLTGYSKSFGSLRNFKDQANATSYCVQQWQAAGAVIVGKTNMHELGMDTTNNNPNYGTPLNPHNDNYYTGGSSGGSAYAVAVGLVPVALGADGGGSIRLPSAYCGIYGLKTSHGRVSCRPTTGMANSNGVVGPMAGNMLDLELAYRVMATPDAGNAASALFPPPGSRAATVGARKKILGVYKTWFDRADAPVRRACWEALGHFCSEFHYEIVYITIPMIHDGQIAHSMTILTEISSSIPDVTGLTAANKVIISVGSKTPAVDFVQAQRVRHLLMQHLAYLFQQHPGMIIVTPTTPNAGWHISGGKGELKYGLSDVNMSLRNMEYVWMANFTGLPSLSAPVAYVDPVQGEGKLPVGLMGMSEWCGEDELIAFGYDCERWLHEGLDGLRKKPENWVDGLKLAEK